MAYRSLQVIWSKQLSKEVIVENGKVTNDDSSFKIELAKDVASSILAKIFGAKKGQDSYPQSSGYKSKGNFIIINYANEFTVRMYMRLLREGRYGIFMLIIEFDIDGPRAIEKLVYKYEDLMLLYRQKVWGANPVVAKGDD